MSLLKIHDQGHDLMRLNVICEQKDVQIRLLHTSLSGPSSSFYVQNFTNVLPGAVPACWLVSNLVCNLRHMLICI